MTRFQLRRVLLGAALVVVPTGYACAADDYDAGKREYDENCAACHGPSGKGDGPYRELLKAAVPDLTVLARNNGGVFPVGRVYEVIDGRQQVASHGPREMPIWGADYSVSAAPAFDDYPFNTEVLVRARILALTEYLYRLQAK